MKYGDYFISHYRYKDPVINFMRIQCFMSSWTRVWTLRLLTSSGDIYARWSNWVPKNILYYDLTGFPVGEAPAAKWKNDTYAWLLFGRVLLNALMMFCYMVSFISSNIFDAYNCLVPKNLGKSKKIPTNSIGLVYLTYIFNTKKKMMKHPYLPIHLAICLCQM